MSNSLANPRRTRLDTWPTQRPETADQEQQATPADSAPSASHDQGNGA
ncbi:hypothetical protein ACFQ07_09595 [Actinomadura adrarensis]|uniref:Uncharacterized protein n=1 Tax=Actinomadura adrarensis TaxID=1819600 RepID=A0ABW3CDK1_9ACTN